MQVDEKGSSGLLCDSQEDRKLAAGRDTTHAEIRKAPTLATGEERLTAGRPSSLPQLCEAAMSSVHFTLHPFFHPEKL
jgi:hypothetical protein